MVIGTALVVGACAEAGRDSEPEPAVPQVTAAAPQVTAAEPVRAAEPAPPVPAVREVATTPDADGSGGGFGPGLARMRESVVSFWSSRPSAGIGTEVTECRGTVRDGAYSGLPGCEPGGERARVDRVVDGDTLRLDDGREIQLIGVDAHEAGTCAGDAATRHARARVEGRQVVLHAERGGRDRSLRPLLHVRYDGPDDEYDLGYSLAHNGLAVPYPAYAGNERYTANVAEAAAVAPAPPTCPPAPAPRDDDSDDSGVGTYRPVPAPRPAVGAPRPDTAAPLPDTVAPAPAAPSGGAAYFKDCAAARAAGAAPILRDQPGYRPPLDADDDGIACERA